MQELIAGALLVFLAVPMIVEPRQVWILSEAWNSKNAEEPSKAFLVTVRTLGVAFGLAGIYLNI